MTTVSMTTVFSTKLTPPRLTGTIVQRLELLDHLAAWRRHRLTVLRSPAGYGKTTLAVLAAQYTLQDANLVWLSLDEADDEPIQYLTCLTEAVASSIPISAAAAVAAIHQNRPQLAMNHLLNGIAQWGKPILFVVDDFHKIQNPAIHQIFAQLVERSPETLHWMLLTRRAVPFSLGKLRLQSQLLELDSNDLQFSRLEVAAFVEKFSHIEFDATSIDLLLAKTRGWIAGIHLSLLSLQYDNREQREVAKDLSLYIRGDNHLHTEYLMGEVLSHQSEKMRHFLIHCSILDRLHPDLCKAVTGEVESAKMLEQAVADQLFLRPLDSLGEWYELHQLFREMLQRHLRRLYRSEHLRSRYRAAADWFLVQDDLSSALQILVAGGELDLAATLLESRSRAAILENRMTELRHWFHILPSAIVDVRPRLLIDRAWLASITDYDDLRNVITHSEPIIKKVKNLPQPLQEEWNILYLLKRFMSNDLQNPYADVMETMKEIDENNHLARGYSHIVAALSAKTEQIREYHTTEAGKAFSFIRFDFGRLLVAGLQATRMLGTGRSDSALSICRETQLILADQKHPQFGEKEFFAYLAGEVYYWRNQLAEAAVSFQDALQNAERENYSLLVLRAQASLQLCDLALGKRVELPEEQMEREQHIWQQNHSLQNDTVLASVVTWQMRRWLGLGRPHEAWQAFQRLSLSLETLSLHSADVLWLVLLTAYVSKGYQLDKLTPIFDMMLERSRASDSIYMQIQIEILRVKQLHQLGHHHAARTSMRQILHDVEQSGYIRMILDEPLLVPLLRAVQTKFAETLLTKMGKPKQLPWSTSLTTQEISILDMLLGGSGISEISDRLVITKGTVKWHLSNIYAKLGVKNQRQAVDVARRIGISHQ